MARGSQDSALRSRVGQSRHKRQDLGEARRDLRSKDERSLAANAVHGRTGSSARAHGPARTHAVVSGGGEDELQLSRKRQTAGAEAGHYEARRQSARGRHGASHSRGGSTPRAEGDVDAEDSSEKGHPGQTVRSSVELRTQDRRNNERQSPSSWKGKALSAMAMKPPEP